MTPTYYEIVSDPKAVLIRFPNHGGAAADIALGERRAKLGEHGYNKPAT
jgi:hypothetical protein